MGISDKIESFILELLKGNDEWLEIGRNELASVFNRVPSQINYVISTRFNSDSGYIVESRRGGGGYLRIKRIEPDDENLIYSAAMRIGREIDYQTSKSILTYLASSGQLDEVCHKIMLSALSDKSLEGAQDKKDEVRASLLKNVLLALV